jgi:hypothetical protein
MYYKILFVKYTDLISKIESLERIKFTIKSLSSFHCEKLKYVIMS